MGLDKMTKEMKREIYQTLISPFNDPSDEQVERELKILLKENPVILKGIGHYMAMTNRPDMVFIRP